MKRSGTRKRCRTPSYFFLVANRSMSPCRSRRPRRRPCERARSGKRRLQPRVRTNSGLFASCDVGACEPRCSTICSCRFSCWRSTMDACILQVQVAQRARSRRRIRVEHSTNLPPRCRIRSKRSCATPGRYLQFLAANHQESRKVFGTRSSAWLEVGALQTQEALNSTMRSKSIARGTVEAHEVSVDVRARGTFRSSLVQLGRVPIALQTWSRSKATRSSDAPRAIARSRGEKPLCLWRLHGGRVPDLTHNLMSAGSSGQARYSRSSRTTARLMAPRAQSGANPQATSTARHRGRCIRWSSPSLPS